MSPERVKSVFYCLAMFVLIKENYSKRTVAQLLLTSQRDERFTKLLTLLKH